MTQLKTSLFAFVCLAAAMPICRADDAKLVEQPLAILAFRERGAEVQGMGGQSADLLFAKLATDPELYLVDRDDLNRTLEEQELNLSGAVDPAQAIQIGRLTGAKIILTGSVFQVENSLHLVAKIIGTETSRVVGASVKGSISDGLDGLAEQLGTEVSKVLRKDAALLVASAPNREDRVAELKNTLGTSNRPSVRIKVTERHVGQKNFDPAAQTEIAMLCQDAGFTVLDDKQSGDQQADVLIEGEGLSELATRRGNLISVKARLEVKAIDRASGRILAVDRQTRMGVDLTEQLSAKDALQAAAADIAMRILPKLVVKPQAGN